MPSDFNISYHYITTGLAENKFGIGMDQLLELARYAAKSPSVDLIGLHCGKYIGRFTDGTDNIIRVDQAVCCMSRQILNEMVSTVECRTSRLCQLSE